MTITLPATVAPNELIQSAWGNSVVAALDELDDEKADLAGAAFTGSVTINRASTGVPLILKQGSESPNLRFQSQASSDMAVFTATATELTLDTLSNNPFLVNAPTTIEVSSGSAVLNLQAVTETPVLTLESTAGTDLLWFTAGVATSFIDAFDDIQIRANGGNALFIDGATQSVTTNGALGVTGNAILGGAIDHNGSTIGFNGTAPVAKSTGWGAPTGTATKTTFATTTVTTQQLAERVKALIDYLTSRGDIGA